MAEYQIRIFERGGRCAAYSCHCGSVFAAVRRAKAIATPDDSIEVWFEMECVFYDHPEKELPRRAGQTDRLA
jgi:hypothetical protein